MNISEEDFLCLSDLRLVIEFRAMDIVAKKVNARDLDPVEQALERMEANQHNAADYTLADLDFHFSIVYASGNMLLIKAMAGIREEIHYILYEMNKVQDTAQYGVDTHRTILSHLKNHDAESAKSLLKTSNNYNQARYSRLFKQDSFVHSR
jgi:DNA-binding GntR family transcriptional regulator